jgi:Ca2+-binding EF-hand superfamily protein
MFNRFFAEFDLDGDGQISKSEMARFLRKFMGIDESPIPKQSLRDDFEDEVASKVHNIWYKYDTDRSGYLDRRETYRFLNDLLTAQGKP